MAERGSQTARSAADFGSSTARTAFGAVVPQLERNIANPTGYSEQDLGRANTAIQQSSGGSNAAAVGQGGLMAARTRNPGAGQYAMAQGVRDAADSGNDAALGVRLKDADLKETKRAAALGQLGGIGATGIGAVAPNVQADVAAKQASYGLMDHVISPILQAASGPATGYFGKRG